MDKFPERTGDGLSHGVVRCDIRYDSTFGAVIGFDKSHIPVEPPIHLPAGGHVRFTFTEIVAYDAAGNRIAVYKLSDGKFTPIATNPT